MFYRAFECWHVSLTYFNFTVSELVLTILRQYRRITRFYNITVISCCILMFVCNQRLLSQSFDYIEGSCVFTTSCLWPVVHVFWFCFELVVAILRQYRRITRLSNITVITCLILMFVWIRGYSHNPSTISKDHAYSITVITRCIFICYFNQSLISQSFDNIEGLPFFTT